MCLNSILRKDGVKVLARVERLQIIQDIEYKLDGSSGRVFQECCVTGGYLQTVIRSVMLYNRECWAIKKKHEIKIM